MYFYLCLFVPNCTQNHVSHVLASANRCKLWFCQTFTMYTVVFLLFYYSFEPFNKYRCWVKFKYNRNNYLVSISHLPLWRPFLLYSSTLFSYYFNFKILFKGYWLVSWRGHDSCGRTRCLPEWRAKGKSKFGKVTLSFFTLCFFCNDIIKYSGSHICNEMFKVLLWSNF